MEDSVSDFFKADPKKKPSKARDDYDDDFEEDVEHTGDSANIKELKK
jgi:hypothetical protein